MCGRYQFTMTQSDELLEITRGIEGKHGTKALNFGEIRPGCKAPVLMPSQSGPDPDLLVWGYRTSKSLVINARAETAAEKPMFRDGIAAQRCVIPSTGFFEWDGAKRQYLFTLLGEEILYMAGLFAVRGGIVSYCILTTAANDSMREVHDRMPLVLKKEQVEPWISDAAEAASFLRMTPPKLEKEPMDDQISLW